MAASLVLLVQEGKQRLSRTWLILLVVGVFLHLLAASSSDLGLDAHVRLNAANDDRFQDPTLAWGKTRIDANAVQDPDTPAVYSGVIAPWMMSATAAKAASVFTVILLAFVAQRRPAWWSSTKQVADLRWPAFILLSPVMLFSASRGYDEGILALFGGIGLIGVYIWDGTQVHHRRWTAAFMGCSTALVLAWKGFDAPLLLGALGFHFVVHEVWERWHQRQRGRTSDPITGQPLKMAGLSSMLTYAMILSLGYRSSTGTFAVIGQEPLTFVLASALALVNVAFMLLIGFMLWPSLLTNIRSMTSVRGLSMTMLSSWISAVLTGVVAYMAALWTLESQLWGRHVLEMALILANNGRYATVMILPLILLLRWISESTIRVEPQPDARSVSRMHIVALLILTPMLLFTSLVGQQLWSEDAGDALLLQMDEEGSTFLMVAPPTLAMHHLYAIKTQVDLDGNRNVDAYWRVSEDASQFLESSPRSIDFLLVAPQSSFVVDEQRWMLVDSQEVPRHLSLIQDGRWHLYRPLG